MAYRKPNKNANYFTLRIHNDDTLALINELAEKTGNRNAVLNDALDLGAPQLYEKYFGTSVKTAAEESAERAARSKDVARELNELKKTVDDLFIEMNIQETLLAGLFNAKACELDGLAPTALALKDGTLCDLPELVAGIKDDLTKSRGGKA